MNQAHSSYAINDEKNPTHIIRQETEKKIIGNHFYSWGGGGQSSWVAKIFLVRWDISSVVM